MHNLKHHLFLAFMLIGIVLLGIVYLLFSGYITQIKTIEDSELVVTWTFNFGGFWGVLWLIIAMLSLLWIAVEFINKWSDSLKPKPHVRRADVLDDIEGL